MSATLGSPVIYVAFTDHQPFTGVLTVQSRRAGAGGSTILWVNKTCGRSTEWA